MFKRITKIILLITIVASFLFAGAASANSPAPWEVGPFNDFYQVEGVVKIIILGLILNFLIEGGILYFWKRKDPLKRNYFIGLVIGNIISLPAFYITTYIFSFSRLSVFYLLFVIIAEIIVILFEAFIYWEELRHMVRFSRTLFLSFILNLSSTVLGYLLLIILAYLNVYIY